MMLEGGGILSPASISQDRAQHLIGGRIIRVETHDLAQRLRPFHLAQLVYLFMQAEALTIIWPTTLFYADAYYA
jgi:hypothetical protein